MRWSNCSVPIPPGHPPRTSLFLGYPDLLIILFLPCPALYKHWNHSFFSTTPFFISHIFALTPVLSREGGGWGQNNLTGALVIKSVLKIQLGSDQTVGQKSITKMT